MPIKYNVVARKNLLKKDEPEKFYAIAKADGEVNFKTISKVFVLLSRAMVPRNSISSTRRLLETTRFSFWQVQI